MYGPVLERRDVTLDHHPSRVTVFLVLTLLSIYAFTGERRILES